MSNIINSAAVDVFPHFDATREIYGVLAKIIITPITALAVR
jgi:hypothetical protein